jgi:hypothetical protein
VHSSLLVCCVAAAVLGCAGTAITTHPLNPAPGAMLARDPATVEVFTTGVPKRPFIEVALIEAREGADEAKLFPDMRARAGAMGCDGLVVIGSNDSVVGMTTGSVAGSVNFTASGFTETVHGYRAACIVWKADAEPGAPSAPAATAPPAPASPAK